MNHLHLFVFTLLLSLSLASLTTLTSSNYDDVLSSHKFVLVKYYAQWCGHCKSLAPIYEQLAETMASPDLVIAEIDEAGSKNIMKKEQIKGYPTIKLFRDGKEVKKYSGPRDLDSLTKFLKAETGKEAVAPPITSMVTSLYSTNFDKKTAGKCTLVKFYAPWCGHCKAMKQDYDKLSSIFAGEASVSIAEVNCDDDRELCSKYDIRGYPTVKLITQSGDVVDFSGKRDVPSLLSFVNEQCGVQRNEDGTLPESVGRVFEYDQVVRKFFTESKSDAIDEMRGIVEENKGDVVAQIYLKVMEKVAENSEYLVVQSKRLQKLIDSGNVAAEKASELNLKRILSVDLWN
ncbi:hypothetical protein GEMRC1_013400 [Eukaryota sp. GEM-RC1]